MAWGKLIVNAAMNATCALTGASGDDILASPAAREWAGMVAHEAAAVAAGLGITLPYPDPAVRVWQHCQTVGQAKPSMLQDFLRGRLTEIDAINGAIVQAGDRLGTRDAVQSRAGAAGQSLRGRWRLEVTGHSLSAERLHFAWDNSLAPTLEIDPGDTVTIETWDAGGHTFTRESTSADAAVPRPMRGHALTGPIAVHGARPGDTLVIDVLEVAPNSWGYTGFFPGRGLLPEDFPTAYLRIWDMAGGFARGVAGAQGAAGAVLRRDGRRACRAGQPQYGSAAPRRRQHGRQAAHRW